MSILITADLHFSANPRDAYRFEFMKRLPELVEKHGVTCVVILGDLTEQKDGHPAELVNRIVAFFSDLSKICKVVVMQGNHDWLSSPDNPFFGFLQHLSKVYWVGKPSELAEYTPTNLNALLLPHSSNPEKDWKALTTLGEYEFIFCHQTFDGSVGDGGRPLTGVSLDLFPNEPTIISGDVHTPQDVENGRLVYVGAPYHIDFGDYYNPRVLIVNGKGKLIEVPVDGPQKWLLDPDFKINLKSLDEDFNTVYPNLAKGDILKIKIPVKSTELGSFPAVTAALRTWGEKHGYVIHQVQPVLTNQVAKPRKLGKAAVRSDTEVVKSFAKARKLNDATLNVGLKLLEG